jgi:hypothetical protein
MRQRGLSVPLCGAASGACSRCVYRRLAPARHQQLHHIHMSIEGRIVQGSPAAAVLPTEIRPCVLHPSQHQDFWYWYDQGLLQPDKIVNVLIAVDSNTEVH